MAGIAATASDPALAARVIAFLADAQNAATLRATGLDPVAALAG